MFEYTVVVFILWIASPLDLLILLPIFGRIFGWW